MDSSHFETRSNELGNARRPTEREINLEKKGGGREFEREIARRRRPSRQGDNYQCRPQSQF